MKPLSLPHRSLPKCVFAFTALACITSAHAEIWGLIDDKGVGHFASHPVDARYELFSKEAWAPNATPAMAAGAAPSVGAGGAPEGMPGTGSPTAARGALAEGPSTAPQGEPPGGVTPTHLTPTRLAPKLAAFFASSPLLKSIQPLLHAAAQSYRLDPALLQALIAAESGFNPAAISPKGALGLMQLTPETAARYGVQGDGRSTQQQKLFDPSINIQAGSRYLRDLLALFHGQLDLALAAYNAGEGAVQKAGNRIPNYPETQNYVRTVTQLYAALQSPAPLPAPAAPLVAAPPHVPTGPNPLRPIRGRGNGLPTP